MNMWIRHIYLDIHIYTYRYVCVYAYKYKYTYTHIFDNMYRERDYTKNQHD